MFKIRKKDKLSLREIQEKLWEIDHEILQVKLSLAEVRNHISDLAVLLGEIEDAEDNVGNSEEGYHEMTVL